MSNYRNNVNIHQCLITKLVNDISLRATSLLVTRVKLNVFPKLLFDSGISIFSAKIATWSSVLHLRESLPSVPFARYIYIQF